MPAASPRSLLPIAQQALAGREWIVAPRTVLSMIPSAPVRQLRRMLGRHLPLDVVYIEDDREDPPDGPEFAWLQRTTRDLPHCGAVWQGIHVVNLRVPDPAAWAAEFRTLEGEVCCSHVDDALLHRRQRFFGIVLRGPLVAWYPTDVWSWLCPLTGRRVLGERIGNADRSEAWMVPAHCTMEAVTDHRGFLRVLDEVGFPARPYSRDPPDPREWDLAAEWDASWR